MISDTVEGASNKMEPQCLGWGSRNLPAGRSAGLVIRHSSGVGEQTGRCLQLGIGVLVSAGYGGKIRQN